MKMKKAKFLKTKRKIKGKVFNLNFDEVIWVNGTKLTRQLIEHNGITSIVPIIDKSYIALLKQYRYGADQIVLEVPAGTIDQGEKSLACAKRELIEETGYHGRNWKLLGKYFPTPAYNRCTVYCYATECFKQTETNLDPNEVLETVIYSKQEVKKMLADNKIIDMKTYLSLDQYFRNY